ncbi:MAG: phosphoribosylformylglycinamidine cyclo-ligase [Gemmatimonas sp.]|nr:phosphoribosylformylglycinamidine cyclo-ligase [Gemmatimonas sp.]
MSERRQLTYRDAGVDIDAASRAMVGVAELVRSTRTADTLSELGSFGGLFHVPPGIDSPVLVASTDSVGTKVLVALMTGRHDTVGEDLVNHCVNDILVQGATPLFVLDYIGVGGLEPGVTETLVSGVARGCLANGCALLGGETAELPDLYRPGEYDLVGTIVGVVAKPQILDGSRIGPGDAVIAIGSSGLHTNGYSLARRIVFGEMGLAPNDPFPGLDDSVANVLLRVHRSYLRALQPWLANDHLHGLAHITGGGLLDNIPRILPEGLSALIDRSSWSTPPLFQVLQREGGVDDAEMYRAFNMGVGMVAVVAADHADSLVESLASAGETAWVAGEIISGARETILS